MLGFREVCPAFTIQKKIEREKQESIIITQNRDLVFAIENPLPAPSLKKNTRTHKSSACLHTCLLTRSLESITENKLGHPFIA
jgi:hypothetical protein